MQKILLVEDEGQIRLLYKRQLEHSNFSVDDAGSAEQATELLKENTYDLVMLDIMLPNMNGLKLLENIRKDEKTKDLKVVVISNLNISTLVKKAYELGALDHILKVKFTPDEIVEKVKGYLSNESKPAKV